MLDHLRWNSYLSNKYKILYVSTPKVACTALKWWFAALEGIKKDVACAADSAETSPELVIHDVFHSLAPNVTGLDPEILAEPLSSAAYFRFALVRNPYKRIFSAWQSKLVLREPPQVGLYLNCDFLDCTIENKDDIARAFEAFLDHLASREAPNYWDAHWTPQAILLRPDLISYSKLVQLEHVKELSAALAKHLGPEIPDPFAFRLMNESLIPYLPEFITVRSEELIRSLYAEDFESFGYDYQKPTAREQFSEDQLSVALKAINLIRGRHQRIADIRNEYQRRTSTLNQTVSENNSRITELRQAVVERDNQIAELKHSLAERDSRIAELHQSMAIAYAIETEKDRQIHELSHVVKRLKDSDTKLAEILASKSWLLTKPLRAFRRSIPVKIQRQDENAAIGKSATISPAVRAADPGGQQGTTPDTDDFDADFYCKAYPDIHCQDNPYVHYIRYGKMEGRLHRAPDPPDVKGLEKLDRSKETILIVSHDASRSGAPILALNIAENFQHRYNVIALVLRGGDLIPDFVDRCDIVLKPFPHAHNPYIASVVLEKLLPRLEITFAVVNSIESRSVLPVLARCLIPTLCLVHEFASYTYPKNAIRDVLLWSSQIVFSARIVYENNAAQCQELKENRSVILPQGRCEVPAKPEMNVDASRMAEIRKLFRPDSLREDTVVILGVGTVQMRKGVDLFLACATRVAELHPGTPFRFVWVGHGFNPDSDMVYSVYLQDQITRAELENHVCFTGEIPEIDLVYQFSDILFLSSRLDPLPNVAIDAMIYRLPVICFDNTTGIADLLKENGLGEGCVIPYLDIERAANRLVSLIDNADQRTSLGEDCENVGKKLFDMESYVASLERLAQACVVSQKTEKTEGLVIETDGSFDREYYLPPTWPSLNRAECVRMFVRSWMSSVYRRKPFPGFHPGIYADHHGISYAKVNPLAAYIEAGKPQGPWQGELLRPLAPSPVKAAKNVPMALHIHAFFAELFADIFDRLEGQHLPLDLLISVPSDDVAKEIGDLTEGYADGMVDIRIVPNRGRDIGSMLTEFSATIQKNYEIIGHVHTKKSRDVKDANMGKVWFEFLLENLLGKKHPMASTILARMVADEQLGLVFPDDPWVVGWSGNKQIAENLATRFDIFELPEQHFNFPVGTMFWARVEALLPLLTGQFGWEDYPEEPLPYDGTILHAIERLVPFVAQKTGYRIAMTNVPGITR